MLRPNSNGLMDVQHKIKVSLHFFLKWWQLCSIQFFGKILCIINKCLFFKKKKHFFYHFILILCCISALLIFCRSSAVSSQPLPSYMHALQWWLYGICQGDFRIGKEDKRDFNGANGMVVMMKKNSSYIHKKYIQNYFIEYKIVLKPMIRSQ